MTATAERRNVALFTLLAAGLIVLAVGLIGQHNWAHAAPASAEDIVHNHIMDTEPLTPACEIRMAALLSAWETKFQITPVDLVIEKSLPERAFYAYEAAAIHTDSCLRVDILAHEFGHHVMQVRNGSTAGHITNARHFCPDGDCANGWTSEPFAPGVEHAAHCIGRAVLTHTLHLPHVDDTILLTSPTYTACPHDDLYAAAEDILLHADFHRLERLRAG